MILDPGFELTLTTNEISHVFYEMYRNAIKNTWTVDEVDFSPDTVDLNRKTQHLMKSSSYKGWWHFFCHW